MEPRGTDSNGRTALILRVQNAADLPLMRRVKRRSVQVRRYLKHLELEDGEGEGGIHVRGKQGSIFAAVRYVPKLAVFAPLRREVDEDGALLAAHDFGEVEVLVEAGGRSVDAGRGVSDERVSALGGVDELAAEPLPGDVPVVEAAEGVVVLHGDLGQVVAGVGLEDVVGDGQVAELAGEELDAGRVRLPLWIAGAAHVHEVFWRSCGDFLVIYNRAI